MEVHKKIWFIIQAIGCSAYDLSAKLVVRNKNSNRVNFDDTQRRRAATVGMRRISTEILDDGTAPMNRKEKIEAMLAEDPKDVFLRYSLAMELRREGRHEDSIRGLRELSRETPPYVPAFFMAAQQLADLGRIDEARTFLRDGIDQARAQNDAHAAAEMSELLASLGRLGESDESDEL